MEIHKQLREFATTLNRFCFIEIMVLGFFCWLCYDLLMWYKSIMTVDSFNATAFWAAMTGIIAGVFTTIKHINSTFDKDK